MGIRVKKMLGYGLTNVRVDDGIIVDPRINPKSPLLTHDHVPSVEDYLKFVRSMKDDGADYGVDHWIIRDKEDLRRYGQMDDLVRWDSEYGIPSVLCIRPLSSPDWYRNDDAIDYVEETYLKPETQAQANRVHRLRHGVYPYSGSYMDCRTGKRFDSSVMTWIRVRNSPGARTPEGREALDLIAAELGFKDHKQAVRYVVPVVPGEIRAIAEYGQLFTSPDVVLQLRPMLYVWWS